MADPFMFDVKDRYGRQILTVGDLLYMIEASGVSHDAHVLIANADDYDNVEAVAVPDPDGGEDARSDWSALTLFPGTQYDTRQF